MDYQKLAKDNLIVKHYAGSIAYGTNNEDSDVDFRGIFIAPQKHIISPWFKTEQVNDESEEDTTIFELNKFMKLLVDQNPNIVETLWIDEKHIVFQTDEYQMIRLAREQLLSSRCSFTYSGYAISQLKRLKGHNKWINDPQQPNEFQQKDFVSLIRNFNDSEKWNIKKWNKGHKLVHFGNNLFGVYKSSKHTIYEKKIGNINFSKDDYEKYKNEIPLAIVKFNQEEYKRKEQHRKDYWKWKNNRNEFRASLEENCGYDSKHAYHLVRLLRMAKEILTDGVVNVFRADAGELLDIRNGSLTYDELIEYADDMNDDIKNVHFKNTDLRKTVDLDMASELICSIYEKHWSEQREEDKIDEQCKRDEFLRKRDDEFFQSIHFNN